MCQIAVYFIIFFDDSHCHNVPCLQMSGRGGEEYTLSEMEAKFALLLGELKDVVAEYDAPKVSDQCDDDQSITIGGKDTAAEIATEVINGPIS